MDLAGFWASDWPTFLRHPVVQATLGGLGSAMLVDYANFRSWKSWHDAVEYQWGVATLRWVQGALGGLLIGLGFTAAT